MAVIVAETATTLATASGFYTAESYLLSTSCGSSNTPAVFSTTPVTFAVTFATASAGAKLRGVVLPICPGPNTHSYTAQDRSVTVKLQELVGGTTWTDRATSTHSKIEIFGTDALVAGAYLTPFVFGTPYTINTTAGIWRFEVSAGAGTSSTALCRDLSNTYIPHVAWSDTAVSFTDNDCLICAAKVTIDKTATVKGVVTAGDAVDYAGWICASPDLTETGICLLEWKNPASASYTFTIDGTFQVSSHGGFRVGSSTNPITYANQAIIIIKDTAFTNAGNSDWYQNNKQSLYLYGEIPTVRYTTLSADALSGQKNIVTTNTTGWAINDIVMVGKSQRVVTNFCDTTTQYKIGNISGKNITLDVNLTEKKISGGTVAVWGKNGIMLRVTSTATWASSMTFWLMAGCMKVNIRGVSNCGCIITAGNGYIVPDAAITFEMNITYNALGFWTSNSGHTWANITSSAQNMIPYYPIVYTDNMSFATGCALSSLALISILRNRVISVNQYNAIVNVTSNSPNSLLDIEDNTYESGYISGYLHTLVGNNITWKNNYYYRMNGYVWTNGTVALSNVFNTIGANMTGNVFEDVERVFQFGTTPIINTVVKGNTITGSTYDIQLGANYNQCIFDSPIKATDLTVLTTSQSSMTLGSRVAILNNGNLTGSDTSYTKYGNFQRTGLGLADTTTHTAGGASMRFAPNSSTNRLEWSFNIPTGNIINKTMMAGVWVKLNSVNYYAGVSQMPRLTVDYDNGTTAYVQTAQTTNWQYIPLPITPLTTYGQITVTLSAMTDATTTDAYVYFDDFSMLYPAGYKLDLGAMDLWANGLPITPPIATVASAQDVWNVLSNNLTGTGTIGNRLSRMTIVGEN